MSISFKRRSPVSRGVSGNSPAPPRRAAARPKSAPPAATRRLRLQPRNRNLPVRGRVRLQRARGGRHHHEGFITFGIRVRLADIVRVALGHQVVQEPERVFGTRPALRRVDDEKRHARQTAHQKWRSSASSRRRIMSQLDFSAGTSALALEVGGRRQRRAATTVSAVGAASAPGTALFEKPSRSVTTKCTPVIPQARNNRLSYMLDRGKWPDSTQRAASREARARLPPSIANCSAPPARFSSVKNA